MKRVIWKFPLSAALTVVEAPALGRVVMCGLDPATGDPAVWIELNPDAPRVQRGFRVYGTGHEILGDGGFPYDVHVGSLICGALVLHVYEVRA